MSNKQRYYSKEKYEASIGVFILGIIFLFVAILSLFFIRFNINFLGLRFWGYWMIIPAFFLFIGGFHQIYVNRKYKNAVRNALIQRGNKGNHKLEHIAREIGIEPNDLLRVLLDLRNKGTIKYRFNPDTGEIILGEAVTYTPSESYSPPGKKLDLPLISEEKSFCVYCGQNLDGDAKFCPICGSKT